MFEIEHLSYYHSSQTYIHISRVHRLEYSNFYVLVTEDSFILANSADPDVMLHSSESWLFAKVSVLGFPLGV